MDYKVNQKLINGVFVTPLKQITDQRGAVYHVLKKKSDSFYGFGEAYISKVNPDVVKGWKYHFKMIQNFTVINGRMKLVLFDNRNKSLTSGVINEFILDDFKNYFRITIPNNIWYSFKCLSSEPCLLLNIADKIHDPKESKSLDIQNETIPFKW